MNKRTLKTAVMFSALIFSALVLAMALALTLVSLLYRTPFFEERHPLVPILIFAAVSIIAGSILARLGSRRPIHAIMDISEATKEIARGNFDVRLNEQLVADELREMARNFNIMAKELSGIEILRSDFVENVSHEIKTPLSAIEGYATLLQRRGLSEEKRQEYTRKILHNTRRLAALSQNILLLTSLENKEIEAGSEAFLLDEQIREMILENEPQWSAKNITLEVDLEECICVANRALLSHVWQNLISNAVKFAPEGGYIRVRLRKRGKWLFAGVADNGPGISQEAQKRIFEKFYQADPSRSTEGNGLGLALAKRIVDLCGGSIAVRSAVGLGSEFTVKLSAETGE